MPFGKPIGLAAALTMTACAATASGTPPVLRSGTLVLEEGRRADLDAGEVREEGADIHFALTSTGRRYLKPESVRVRIGKVEKKEPDFARCAKTATSSKPIEISLLTEGTYVCVRTNEGRYSQFRVNAPVGRSPGKLRIGYTTWEKRGD